MRVEFIQPFVVAASEVLQTETGAKVTRGSLSLHSSAIRLSEVATLISLIGQVEGLVAFSMPKSMCLQIVSRMMGQECEQLDELTQSGIAELGNVIAGRAATKLSQAGYQVDISVPTLIIGQGATIPMLQIQRLLVPLESELGTMEIHLAVRQR